MSKKGLTSTQALLKLLYDEDGIASCPECGIVLNVEEEFLESRYKANKMLHAFIRHCMLNWPGDHEFKIIGGPDKDREYHLRCWLTVFGAEHIKPAVVRDWETPRQYEMVIRMMERELSWMRINKRWGWTLPVKGGLMIHEAESISIFGKNSLGWRGFCDVTKKIYDFIYKETGIDLKDWKGDFEEMWGSEKWQQDV